jgi:hypothetical protein
MVVSLYVMTIADHCRVCTSVSIVSIGNVVAVIRRLQDPADALEGYATLLSNRHGSMNYSTEFGAEVRTRHHFEFFVALWKAME